LTVVYNIESTIACQKDWSRDEFIGKLRIAMGVVGVIDNLKVEIQVKEDGSLLNREMQIASGAIVRGKMSKDEEKIKQKGFSSRTMKTRA
jgi:hypothetical protein